MSARASSPNFGRLAGIAGVVSAVLLLIGLIASFAQGAPPAVDGEATDVANYFSENEGLAKLSALLNFLPLLTLPLLFIGWYSTRRDAGGYPATAGATGTGGGSWLETAWARVALIAFIAFGVFSTVQGAAAFAIALGVTDDFGGQPAIAGSLFDLYNALGAATALAAALFLWSVANADDRDGGRGEGLLDARGESVADTRGSEASPSWLKPLLYAGAAAALLSFLTPFLETDILTWFGLIAYLAFIVWVGVTGMSLMKRHDTGTTTRGTA